MKTKENTRILYMGTPKMSAEVLKHLIESGFNIIGVVAQEDQYVGRKHILEKVPTKIVAESYNIPVYQPHRIRKDFNFVKQLSPDLIITMAYGQIVPKELLDIPPLGCLNLHGSILPKYRGAAPIQRAIMDGENITGITLMEMAEGMDNGRMYSFEYVDILPNDNYSSLCLKLIDACKTIIDRDLVKYLQGTLEGTTQDETKVTIATKIMPEDEKLSLSFSVNQFINHVRGLSDEPGGYVFIDDLKFKIFKCHQINDLVENPIGQIVLKKNIILQLKDGQIMLDEVQLEGKKKMDGKSFVNGWKLDPIIIAK